MLTKAPEPIPPMPRTSNDKTRRAGFLLLCNNAIEEPVIVKKSISVKVVIIREGRRAVYYSLRGCVYSFYLYTVWGQTDRFAPLEIEEIEECPPFYESG
jgi:hypothetical protein